MKSEWRPAIHRAMRQAAEREAERTGSSSFNYRWEHVTTVVTLTRKLARLTGADEEIMEAAAWLHDVTKSDGEDHARTGALFAADFLSQTDFPEEKIPAVAQAIFEHQGLSRDEPLTELESMVLWDADKLSKLGLTAAFHFSALILEGVQPVTTAGLLSDLGSVDWQRQTVQSLHTEPARRAAEMRMASYERLLADLGRELQGDDLTG